jgi:Peptidase family S41
MPNRRATPSTRRPVLAALLLAAAAALPSPPAAGAPAPETIEAREVPAAAIRADFDALYAHLRSAHFNLYARRSKAAYDRLYWTMRRGMTTDAPPLEVIRRFQRFAAFGKVAHARLDAQYGAFARFRAAGGKAFPLSLRLIGRRAFIGDNRSGVAAIRAGDELIALDGRPIGEWLRRGRRNLSADTDYLAAALMELDLPMLLWLEAGERSAFRLVLRRGHGGEIRAVVPARTAAEMQSAAAAQPRRLDLAATDRSARMLAHAVAYLRPGPFYNNEAGAADPYDTSAFRRFIDQSFEGFLSAGAVALLVDLRDNPGGDSSFSDLMVSWFATRPYRFNSAFRIKVSPEAVDSNRRRLATGPDPVSPKFAALYAAARLGAVVAFDTPFAQPRAGARFTGRVFVLVNRNSYSNAVAVAATVQDYGFGRILGEETSDLATTYGAMETFTLPRTGLVVGFPKAYIVRPSGDEAPRGVVPDVAIATPVVEGADDPVLARAAAIAAGS